MNMYPFSNILRNLNWILLSKSFWGILKLLKFLKNGPEVKPSFQFLSWNFLLLLLFVIEQNRLF